MDNLPDAQAASAAQDVLQLARGAGRGEVLLVLMSGGGSALLPCPVEGVSLEEKRTVGVSVCCISKATAKTPQSWKHPEIYYFSLIYYVYE